MACRGRTVLALLPLDGCVGQRGCDQDGFRGGDDGAVGGVRVIRSYCP
jgi:hypothetical protein